MNEELQKQLAGMIELFKNGVMSAADFAHAQIPAVLHELIRWKTTMYLVGMAVGLAIWILGNVGITKWWKMYYKTYKEVVDDSAGTIFLPYILANIIGAMIFGIKLWDYLFITMAPRIWLLDYFRHMLR